MTEIGKYNTLEIVKELDFGLYLDGKELGEILLPKRYVPVNVSIGDSIEVFIYHDSEDRIIATTEMPNAIVGDFALMQVIAVNQVGAFLDWGLKKDLLVPFREQKKKMEEGNSYVVFVYLDSESKRIVASAKLDKFLDNIPAEFEINQEVDLLIIDKTDLGYKAIINQTHSGMLYENEVFIPLKRGMKVKGFIKNIREDEKIDLYLQKAGFEKVDDFAEIFIKYLSDNKGFTVITDKSPSEKIYDTFGVSKKTFKKSIGALYKKRIISIEENGIKLISKPEKH